MTPPRGQTPRSLKKHTYTLRALAWIAFALYGAVLLKLTLLRQAHPLPHLLTVSDRLEWANLIPLRSIAFYLGGNETPATALRNLGGNVLAFVPMGLLLPILSGRFRRLRRVLVLCLCASLSIEIAQLATGLGVFDVDDIILNALGGLVGALANQGVSALATRLRRHPSTPAPGPGDLLRKPGD